MKPNQCEDCGLPILPAEHVAEIERMLRGPIPEKLTKAQEAALEAAIERMRESAP